MANTRRLLARRVSIGGKWYGPGPVDDDIAAKITNPKAWMAADEATDEVAEVYERITGTSTGAQLAVRVNVNGTWYGPDTPVPDDIAVKITNPKAWAGGKPPALAPKASDGDTDLIPPTGGDTDLIPPTGGDTDLIPPTGGDGQEAGQTEPGDGTGQTPASAPRKGGSARKG